MSLISTVDDHTQDTASVASGSSATKKKYNPKVYHHDNQPLIK